MHDREPSGSEVAAHEELLRAITCVDWWVADDGRISSAAFRVTSPFSVDVRSLTSDDEFLRRFTDAAGLVMFVAGPARVLGYDARLEPDEDDPTHLAHAHVYSDFGNKQGKIAARKMVQISTLIKSPGFNPT